MKRLSFILMMGLIYTGCSSSKVNESNIKVVKDSEVKWEKLNPARGDKSPKAATLWGDRKADVATGFLVKFVDGFSSPPHIHNVSYRGVVISGLIHNDDPDAARMWMPTGSFWTQPKGEAHITAAKGQTNIAYIEIEQGPYLVHPTQEAFDNGERPVNVDKSNIVWQKTRGARGVKISYLWGQPKLKSGSLIKLPSGFEGKIKSMGESFKAVIIKGELDHLNKSDATTLSTGSYFSSEGSAAHKIKAKTETIIYVRSHGRYKVKS